MAKVQFSPLRIHANYFFAMSEAGMIQTKYDVAFGKTQLDQRLPPKRLNDDTMPRVRRDVLTDQNHQDW